MSAANLFRQSDGRWVTKYDLDRALRVVGAHDCKVLYMHTGLSFGLPNPDLSRAQLLGAIYEAIGRLRVPTLCVPTFTFSFCNGEPFDVAHSRSRMGALNEFIRQCPEAIRSVDPLMSVAMVGAERGLVENLGRESIGAGSTFDRLRQCEQVKFLFLGVRLGDCFTYMHYLEWLAQVPYRYNRDFTGQIVQDGNTREDTFTLFVRYNNVKPNAASYTYEDLLTDKEILKVAPLGDNFLRCVAEPAAREVYLELIGRAPNFFIQRPFVVTEADPTFNAHQMLAL